MYSYNLFFSSWQCRLVVALLFVVLTTATIAAQDTSKHVTAKSAQSAAIATIDPKLIGIWGVDERGGYDFWADGTFIMEGSVTYRFDASKGVWHYWQPKTPAIKMAADYKLSADGKSLSINLKAGKPFVTLKRIK